METVFIKIRKLIGILFISIAALTAEGDLVYVSGPSFPTGSIWGWWDPANLDMDNDGAVDFSFWSSGMLCTMDIPTSGCGWPFYIKTPTTNEVQAIGSFTAALPLGMMVGTQAQAAASWIVPEGFYGAGIANWWYSLQGREVNGHLVHNGWSGGVGEAGVGYFGVRFYASDGLHYGWIRSRLPQAVSSNVFEATPIIVDWAYETQPNTPIRAGDIGQDSDSVQLKVEFFDVGRRHRWFNRQLGNGSLILTDNQLRGELHLTGDFSTAKLQGPNIPHPRGKSKPVFDFPPPLVRGTNHTAFFGEAALTRVQLLQLARGQLYISIDDCDVIGRITPMEDDRRRGR